jgi:S-adenosylmethionine hydrolase
MKKLITIADWAGDTLACQEFKSTVEAYLKDSNYSRISFVTSSPSTLHTSFIVSQVVETEERYGRPQKLVIFQNTDPRLQGKRGEFIIIRLISDLIICGPNAEYNFSMIKKKISNIYRYSGLNNNSQFRSRDLYARVCAHLIDEMEDELDLEEISSTVIPELEGHFVVHVDNFGNIKTNIKAEELKGKIEFGEFVTVKINNVTKKAKYINNLFGGIPGELTIYPGSSGSQNNPFLEISVWRNFTEENPTTGLNEFNKSQPGMKVEISF